MTAPIRTAEEMREAAARLFDDTECHTEYTFELAAMAIRSLPIAAPSRPTVEEALAAYANGYAQDAPLTPDARFRAGLTAVLALCEGETRDRWASWEEAAEALKNAYDDAYYAAETPPHPWAEMAARAVLVKAPPMEG